MTRTVVYTGTREVYDAMVIACKSLLYHHGADQAYFLIEDDIKPGWLPDNVKTMNVSNQTFFRHDGPNYNNRWTYMTLMKAAVPLMFSGRVLVLDVDTIVDGNIDALWRLPFGPLYMAVEVGRSGAPYYNAGVMLMDTDSLHHEADEIIRVLNERKFDFGEQDAINEVMRGRISALPPEYNVSNWTVRPAGTPKIVHFAAERHYIDKPLFRQYAQLDWGNLNASQNE